VPGFSFAAPSDWTVTTSARKAVAEHGETELVQVSTFPLAKPYHPGRFTETKPEIERAAKQLQAQLHSGLVERELTVAGERTLQFDLEHDGVVEQVTFVLRGQTEYQLYCRRGKDDSAQPCERLAATFTPR